MKRILLALSLAATAVTAQAGEVRTFANHKDCIETVSALERTESMPAWYKQSLATPTYTDKVYGNARVVHKDGKIYAFRCIYAWSNTVEIDTELEYLAKKYEVEKKISAEEAKERNYRKDLLRKLD